MCNNTQVTTALWFKTCPICREFGRPVRACCFSVAGASYLCGAQRGVSGAARVFAGERRLVLAAQRAQQRGEQGEDAEPAYRAAHAQPHHRIS